MNKKIMIVGGIVLLALLAFLWSRRTSTAPSAPTSQTSGEVMSESAEFAKAVESGRPTACTLTKDGQSMEYFISGKKMRTNMVANQVTSHMINDGVYMYIWSDGQKQGSKMAVPTEEETQKTLEQAKEYEKNNPAPAFGTASDYEGMQNLGYTINCQPSSASGADFIPPSDVEFIDPTAMMKNITKPGASGQIDYQKLQEQYGMVDQDNN